VSDLDVSFNERINPDTLFGEIDVWGDESVSGPYPRQWRLGIPEDSYAFQLMAPLGRYHLAFLGVVPVEPDVSVPVFFRERPKVRMVMSPLLLAALYTMRLTNRSVIGLAKLPSGEWKPITMKGVRNYLGCGPEKGRVWMERGVLVVSGSRRFPWFVVVALTYFSSQGERWTGVSMLDVVDYLWDWLESFTGKRTRGSRGEAEVAGVPDR
jgi:hypothetical protein